MRLTNEPGAVGLGENGHRLFGGGAVQVEAALGLAVGQEVHGVKVGQADVGGLGHGHAHQPQQHWDHGWTRGLGNDFVCVSVCVCVCVCVCVVFANCRRRRRDAATLRPPPPGDMIWFCTSAASESALLLPFVSFRFFLVCKVLPGSFFRVCRCYWVFPNLVSYWGIAWVRLGSTGFHWVSLGFTGFHRVLLGVTRFY